MARFTMKTVMAPEVVANGHADAGWESAEAWRRDRDMVHDPGRLLIMATAMRTGGATFQELRTKLGLTDQEVAGHAKRLESAGLLETSKEIGGTGLVITFTPTPRGRTAMQAYCDWMRDILEGLPGSGA